MCFKGFSCDKQMISKCKTEKPAKPHVCKKGFLPLKAPYLTAFSNILFLGKCERERVLDLEVAL